LVLAEQSTSENTWLSGQYEAEHAVDIAVRITMGNDTIERRVSTAKNRYAPTKRCAVNLEYDGLFML